MPKSPMLAGHGLLDAGGAYYDRRGRFTSMQRADAPILYGRCECGHTFGPGWTRGQIRAAHRTHKDTLRPTPSEED